MSSIFENRVAFGAKWSYFCKKHWICACNFIVQTQAHFSIKFRYWELLKLFVYTICHVKIKRKFRYRYVRENGMYFYNFSRKSPTPFELLGLFNVPPSCDFMNERIEVPGTPHKAKKKVVGCWFVGGENKIKNWRRTRQELIYRRRQSHLSC